MAESVSETSKALALLEELQAGVEEGSALDATCEELRTALATLVERMAALNQENDKLNMENRDLLEKWSQRGVIADTLAEALERIHNAAEALRELPPDDFGLVERTARAHLWQASFDAREALAAYREARK